MRSYRPGLSELGGFSGGLPMPTLAGVAFRTSPTGHWPSKTETSHGQKRGLTLPRGSPCAWSGGALGVPLLWWEWRRVSGVASSALQCGTCVLSVTTPSCHPPAGCLYLLVFLPLNYPSWKLIWSGQTTAKLQVLQYALEVSKSWTNREAESTFQGMI